VSAERQALGPLVMKGTNCFPGKWFLQIEGGLHVEIMRFHWLSCLQCMLLVAFGEFRKVSISRFTD
jgi:hypothetical protein